MQPQRRTRNHRPLSHLETSFHTAELNNSSSQLSSSNSVSFSISSRCQSFTWRFHHTHVPLSLLAIFRNSYMTWLKLSNQSPHLPMKNTNTSFFSGDARAAGNYVLSPYFIKFFFKFSSTVHQFLKKKTLIYFILKVDIHSYSMQFIILCHRL